jgi:hypothetical protein
MSGVRCKLEYSFYNTEKTDSNIVFKDKGEESGRELRKEIKQICKEDKKEYKNTPIKNQRKADQPSGGLRPPLGPPPPGGGTSAKSGWRRGNEVAEDKYKAHPYDPIGKDGKPVVPLRYRNVLTGNKIGGYIGGVKIDNKVRRYVKTSIDEYPLITS